MKDAALLIDYRGTYGGPSSRDEILRVLKEALALVEATDRGTRLSCGGLRIEGWLPDQDGSRDPGPRGRG